MSSYFDEHDCEPLGDQPGPQGNELLELARFLVLTGNWNREEFADLFHQRVPPPTSREFIEQLPSRIVREESEEQSCPICLKKYEGEEEVNMLPCQHEFHASCLLPWLQKTSSCPLCRQDLPTGNPEWEEMRRQKKREATRKLELEQLHDSMFG